ncbi:unnamed protein product [Cyprideis torosa]|uniref:Uncharacterized protein n=1 Tax=Cyprideis torosa TaxID=163714 RepID=A0A7R8WBL2_9CRUS|nr:unnamed protein product [Cyprideis torosa]CAG0887060.1 unnamed protein product [Cyprideis torosa]
MSPYLQLKDTVLNFIRSHPLMDDAVQHEQGDPIFVKRDVIFTHIVTDPVHSSGKRRGNNAIFTATNDGRLLKIAQWFDITGRSHSEIVDVVQVTNYEPIRAMVISRKLHSLYIASDSAVHQVDYKSCSSRHNSCFKCVRDPHCGWNAEVEPRGGCRNFGPNTNLLQDISGSIPSICDESIPKQRIQAHWGQTLYLECPVVGHLREKVSWSHVTSTGRNLLPQKSRKHLLTSENGLVIASLTRREAGRYDCSVGNVLLRSFNVTMDDKTCATPTKPMEFQQAYADWCREFERYKYAMKNWQKKQLECDAVSRKVEMPPQIPIQ